jgi:hypothetical protein
MKDEKQTFSAIHNLYFIIFSVGHATSKLPEWQIARDPVM